MQFDLLAPSRLEPNGHSKQAQNVEQTFSQCDDIDSKLEQYLKIMSAVSKRGKNWVHTCPKYCKTF